jgi:hypothetical protein
MSDTFSCATNLSTVVEMMDSITNDKDEYHIEILIYESSYLFEVVKKIAKNNPINKIFKEEIRM